ncbi:hypothetical protein [Promicromonospora panici]|uniref:hypothetical protein n=1 Tax=Promicromonospora panici TaxID=2219658 RepID=UPI00101B9C0F|nr:hypothetical protein [Promicromonospora panici]
MSETDVPYGARPGSQHTWAPGAAPDSADPGGGGVRERVAETASRVGDAGRETAHDAREGARDVAHEATDQARGLADRTRTELRSQAGSQQQRLAAGLRSLGDELSQMAGGTQDPGYASDIVERAGDATRRAAQWFEEREPATVLHEVENFARRRPGVFLAVAAGAGLIVGRFLRGAKDAPDDGGGSTETAGTTARTGIPAGHMPPTLPPTAPDGPRPQTAGGDTDVEHT